MYLHTWTSKLLRLDNIERYRIARLVMVVSALNIQVQPTDRREIGHSSLVQIRACGLGWNSISPAFAWVMRQSKLTPITSKTPAFPQQTASENELIQWRARRWRRRNLTLLNGRSFPLSIITRSAHLILILRRNHDSKWNWKLS